MNKQYELPESLDDDPRIGARAYVPIDNKEGEIEFIFRFSDGEELYSVTYGACGHGGLEANEMVLK